MELYVVQLVKVQQDESGEAEVIGVYSTEENANAAMERAQDAELDDSVEVFLLVDKFDLDKDGRTDGYAVEYTEEEDDSSNN
ncbi:MAG: DUF7336 domain-containing protein, partial [Acidimicrobiales bacterium]